MGTDQDRKAWIPACAGMTTRGRTIANRSTLKVAKDHELLRMLMVCTTEKPKQSSQRLRPGIKTATTKYAKHAKGMAEQATVHDFQNSSHFTHHAPARFNFFFSRLSRVS